MPAIRTQTKHQTLGNYELLAEIGRGSFGTVYQARHWQTDRVVAVKAVHATLTKNPALLKRFQQECLVAAKIDHPNTVRVLEYSVQPPQPYLVMELVDGISLGEYLERKGKMAEAESLRLAVQACQGLEQMHNLGLLHRDIKPDNLMVTPGGLLKITDLGLAKHVDTGLDLTRPGTGLGTPNFIAPEQFRNAKNVDRRCDVYGLGATLYQLVTGVLPFAGASPVDILTAKLKNQLVPPEKLVPWLSPGLCAVLRKALQTDPEHRYGSCWELAEALVEINGGLGDDFERLASSKDHWYLQYHDDESHAVRATGSTAAVARALSRGSSRMLGTLRVARTLAGPFRSPDRFVELISALALAEQEGGEPVPRRRSSGELRVSSPGARRRVSDPAVRTPTGLPTVVADKPRQAAPDGRATPLPTPPAPPTPSVDASRAADFGQVHALRVKPSEGDGAWWKAVAILIVGGSAALAALRFLLPYLK